MDTFSKKFDNIVNNYFEIMNKDNTITTEERTLFLEQLKEEFLKFYSPSADITHVFLLGLLNDTIYMLKHQITETQTNETTVDVTIEKTNDNVVYSGNKYNETTGPTSIDTIKKPFFNGLKCIKPFSSKLKYISKFGETVYVPQYLVVEDSSSLIINTTFSNNTKFEILS